MNKIEMHLQELGLSLPPATKPIAHYVPWVVSDKLVFLAGQLPMNGGKPSVTGAVGSVVSTQQANEAARLCGLHLLAQLRDACAGDLGRVVRMVKLVGFVNCDPSFTDISKVLNGASELMVEIFGEAGKHARSAVGVSVLPLGASVEIEAIAEIT